MRSRSRVRAARAGWIFGSLAVLAIVCGGCGGGSEADRIGVGAECVVDEDCDDDGDQACLLQFRGGYCGVTPCAADDECPDGSACIDHTDGVSYCFLVCVDKIDCNRNRSVDNESNCSSNVVFVEGAQGRKACVPPSSG